MSSTHDVRLRRDVRLTTDGAERVYAGDTITE